MSVSVGKVGQEPNWIRDNDWSPAARIEWAHTIMATSSRDWSRYDRGDCRYRDAETWALRCLICCETKEEALQTWYDFCGETDPQ